MRARYDVHWTGRHDRSSPARSPPAIQKCEQAGVKVVMITGDHPLTARAVARELGLLKADRVAIGAEVEAMGEMSFTRQ